LRVVAGRRLELARLGNTRKFKLLQDVELEISMTPTNSNDYFGYRDKIS